jgi:hypothetical protein
LREFCDPVYLHQVKTAAGGKDAQSRGDLADALDAVAPASTPEEWRVHFHVPLYFTGYQGIASTADGLTPAFFRAARDVGATHLEIETYTFDVLPDALRERAVEQSLADEYAWLLQRCG